MGFNGFRVATKESLTIFGLHISVFLFPPNTVLIHDVGVSMRVTTATLSVVLLKVSKGVHNIFIIPGQLADFNVDCFSLVCC